MNQNEPIFLNLYIRDTENRKHSFNQRLRRLCTRRMLKNVEFRRMILIFNTHNLPVSNNFRIFAVRFCVSYIEIQKNGSD